MRLLAINSFSQRMTILSWKREPKVFSYCGQYCSYKMHYIKLLWSSSWVLFVNPKIHWLWWIETCFGHWMLLLFPKLIAAILPITLFFRPSHYIFFFLKKKRSLFVLFFVSSSSLPSHLFSCSVFDFLAIFWNFFFLHFFWI